MAHALLQVTVTRFVNQALAAVNSTGPFSEATFAFTPHPNRGVSRTGDALIVSKPNRKIRIEFLDVDYQPLGIYFTSVGRVPTDPNGRGNMNNRMTGASGRRNFVEFNATRADATRDPNDFRWKFIIPFTNLATSEFGVWDPEISNTNQDSGAPPGVKGGKPAKPAKQSRNSRAKPKRRR